IIVALRRFIVMFLLFSYFLFPNNQLYARRLRIPDLPTDNFMEKLFEGLEDYCVEEATKPEFFAENWDLLDLGIRVVFGENTFLEIRESPGNALIMQLFGTLTPEEKVALQTIRDNIYYEFQQRYPDDEDYIVLFLDASRKKLGKKEIELAYSILTLSQEDFELLIRDFREGGEGLGSNALPEEILEEIYEFADILEEFVESGLIDLSSFPLSRIEFIDSLMEAINKVDEGYIDIDEEEVLEVIKEEVRSVVYLLSGKYGEIIYRMIYREILEPSHRILTAQYNLKDLSEEGFSQISPEVLRHGIFIGLGKSSFVEFRMTDELGIMNVVGHIPELSLPYLKGTEEQFYKLCQERNVIMHILDGLSVSPREPARDAFGISHLSEEEFSILVKDIRAGGTSSGFFGVDIGLVDLITSMYKDIIEYEFKKLGLPVEDLIMDKTELFSHIMALVSTYEEIITKYKMGSGIFGEEGKISYKEAEERISRYKKYLNALFSERGDIIYRIFYRDFLRNDPRVIKIIRFGY
ncbi:MAG: hypothetical protein AB7E08_05610, partial [Candidatus Omnitrophota bacterium]